MLKDLKNYLPSIDLANYVALARNAPRETVGLVMIGAAGVGAYLWNNTAARINGIDKTKGKLR